MRKTKALLLFAVLAVPALSSAHAAAEATRLGAPPDSARTHATETAQHLKKQIDLLWDRIFDLEDEIGDMRARAQKQGTRQSPSVFNPGITVFGNFLGRTDDRTVFTEGGDPIDDKFNLREVELDFRSAIDPWADGVVIATFESEVPGTYRAEIEEGYITLKKLPVINAAPLGLKLKVGRFRGEFGRFNKIHTHDLPQMTRPLVLQTFLGEEGLIRSGVSALVFLPVPGENHTVELTTEVTNGGGLPGAPPAASERPALTGRLKWFWDVHPGHNLELGASSYLGDAPGGGDLEVKLYGTDFTYLWKPFSHGEWKSFLLGGEVFVADLPGDAAPVGFYAWSQYQFSRQLYLGLRYESTEPVEDPAAPDLQSLGGYLTYYTTEFLRFRLGYEHTGEIIGRAGNQDSAFFELNFVFGSHPVEPYWVNR